eukprot:8232672-Alexandrium_andersonii.AAC.1
MDVGRFSSSQRLIFSRGCCELCEVAVGEHPFFCNACWRAAAGRRGVCQGAFEQLANEQRVDRGRRGAPVWQKGVAHVWLLGAAEGGAGVAKCAAQSSAPLCGFFAGFLVGAC